MQNPWSGEGSLASTYLDLKTPPSIFAHPVDERIDGCVKWGQTQKEVITVDAIKLEFGTGAAHVRHLVATPFGRRF